MKFTLVSKKNETSNVKSFFWKPEKPLTFKAGQYLYYTLPKLEYPDTRGAIRHFTISSSPTEGNLIRLTTKIREDSGYKKTLDDLSPGDTVESDGPNGIFTLDEESSDTNVFIAGGIGITPFRSMVKDVVDKNLHVKINLIYSNSDEKFIFGDELREIDAKYDNIQIEFFNSSKQGHLDNIKIIKMIQKWGLDSAKCIWWLCGPPGMIDAIETALGKMNVPLDNIRSEKFTGY